MRHLFLSLFLVVPCLAAFDDNKRASDDRADEAHRTLLESTDRGAGVRPFYRGGDV